MLSLIKSLMKNKIVTETAAFGQESPGRGLPLIDVKSCPPGCKQCELVCPTGALQQRRADPKTCIYCHSCCQVCPASAIAETEVPLLKESPSLETVGQQLRERVKQVCQSSLHIRYVDAGACNACDFEINALTNPIYDLQQFGIDFVASPRHADMLLVTGSVTRNLEIALQKTYAACPQPTLVVAVGACASGGGIFKEAYATGGGVDKHLPVDVYVPGCPPTPLQIVKGILAAINRK